MSVLNLVKTSFSSGELSPDLLGRGDLRSYENGAMKLRNVFVHPTGGISRRSGLRYLDTLDGVGRLVAFEFNTEQVYLLNFKDEAVDVYLDGVKIASFDTPWTEDQLSTIRWTQSADTLLVTHRDVPPRKITRSSDADWSVAEWQYEEVDDSLMQPYFKFEDDDLTFTPSGTTGDITITASKDFFSDDYIGLRFRLAEGEVLVTAVNSATEIAATVKVELSETDETKNWEEPAFSTLRGWPISVTFHQDRLVIGGSRDLPNRLWLSKSSDLMNFDLGEGLDDESIEFQILSDQVNAICAIFSGRHLQVFTSGSEWMVTGDPLTPSNIQLSRQTRIGSILKRYVPPLNVDGATLFAGANGDEIREFIYTDLEEAYQANDLAMLSKHLIKDPLDQDYDAVKRLLNVVVADGSMAFVTNYRTEKITAWSLAETDGRFLSVAVAGRNTYVIVKRNDSYFLEVFDDDLHTDCALTGDSEEPKKTWKGLEHLEGKKVKVRADEALINDCTVLDGAINLPYEVSQIEVGLGFFHQIEPLPPVITSGTSSIMQMRSYRLIDISFRVKNTSAFMAETTGKGYRHVLMPHLDTADFLDSPPTAYTGDVVVKAFGWIRDLQKPIWSVKGDEPLDLNILSVTTKIKVGE
ncbi:MAG: hypothetical protein AB7U85_02100 [Alphaproteobacteria bacterium]